MANTAGWSKTDAGALGAIAITPSDTVVLTKFCRALYVGGTGDVKVRMIDGDIATFSALPTGALLPIQFDLVFLTSTTATLLIGLY